MDIEIEAIKPGVFFLLFPKSYVNYIRTLAHNDFDYVRAGKRIRRYVTADAINFVPNLDRSQQKRVTRICPHHPIASRTYHTWTFWYHLLMLNAGSACW
jgi:hypothetical protein